MILSNVMRLAPANLAKLSYGESLKLYIEEVKGEDFDAIPTKSELLSEIDGLLEEIEEAYSNDDSEGGDSLSEMLDITANLYEKTV